MARADAKRHKIRTVLAVLMVAFATGGIIAADAMMNAGPRSIDQAWEQLPDGIEADITALALPDGAPFPQPPEGVFTPVMVDLETIPADESEIAAVVGQAELHPYWISGELIITSSAIDPFDDDAVVTDSRMGTTTLMEIDPQVFAQLAPTPSEGALPASGEVMVTRDIADQLNVSVGDQVTVFGPPDIGWYGAEGAITHVLESSSQVATVSAITDDESSSQQIWMQPGWLSEAVAAEPEGINRHWVITKPVLDWDGIRQLNELQTWAVSRQVLLDPPDPSEQYEMPVSSEATLAAVIFPILGGTLTLIFMVATITPAFAVATTQQRRTLGLMAATGASPHDLRRTVTAQGVIIGLLGGVIGGLLGVLGSLLWGWWQFPQFSALSMVRWPTVVLVFLVAVAISTISALPPAISASRHDIMAALADRTTTKPTDLKRRALLGVGLTVVAVICAVVSFTLPVSFDDSARPQAPAATGFLVFVAVVALSIGVIAVTGELFAWLQRRGQRLPLSSRLAIGDAVRHPARSVPATAALLICTMLVTATMIRWSTESHTDRDYSYAVIESDSLFVFATTPVSDSFDASLFSFAASEADDITDFTRHSIYGWQFRQDDYPTVVPARTCEDPDQNPSKESWLLPEAPFTCDDEHYSPGFSNIGWLDHDRLVMTPEALVASGHPGVEEAAEVLAAGGVVVNAAWALDDDGRVQIDFGGDIGIREFDGALVTHYPGRFVIAPETLADLGVAQPRLLGQYWEGDFNAINTPRLKNTVEQTVPLVRATSQGPRWHPMAQHLVGMLTAATVVIMVVSLVLAKAQSRRLFATMHSVGASRGFLRRYSLNQAALMCAVAVPLGLIAGLAVGFYWVEWSERLDWRQYRTTVVPIVDIAAIMLFLRGTVLAAAAVVGSRLPPLYRRR